MMKMPVVTSAIATRSTPTNELTARGQKIIALRDRPPLMMTSQAIKSSKQQPAMTRMTVTMMPRMRSASAGLRSMA
jgi:hypothetical protein